MSGPAEKSFTINWDQISPKGLVRLLLGLDLVAVNLDISKYRDESCHELFAVILFFDISVHGFLYTDTASMCVRNANKKKHKPQQ